MTQLTDLLPPRFDRIIMDTSKYEGGHVVDHAGPTNFGITQKTYDAYNKSRGLPLSSVKGMKPEMAKKIAYEDFFIRPKFDKFSDPVAEILFDYGFHAGPGTATKSLQKVVGSKADGAIGPRTIKATEDFIQQYGEKELLQKMINERQSHNEGLIIKNPAKYKKYEEGWKNRIQSIKDKFDLSWLNLFGSNAYAAEIDQKEFTIDDILSLPPVDEGEEKNIFTLDEIMNLPPKGYEVPQLKALPADYEMRPPTPEEELQSFGFNVNRMTEQIFEAHTGLDAKKSEIVKKSLEKGAGYISSSMLMGPLYALGFEVYRQAKSAVVSSIKKEELSLLDQKVLSELLPDDMNKWAKVGVYATEVLSDIALMAGAAGLAKQGLLKDGLKNIGNKLSKAGYGEGQVTIPKEAIQQAAKGTSLEKSANFWVQSKLWKPVQKAPEVAKIGAPAPSTPVVPQVGVPSAPPAVKVPPQTASDAVKQVDPLIQEAKKYKSAEEFVEANESRKIQFAETGKPITVKLYHGSPDARFAEEFDPNKKGYYPQLPEALPDNTEFIAMGGKIRSGFAPKSITGNIGVSFTDDYTTAKSYANKPAFDYQNSVPMVLERYVTFKNPKVYDLGGKEWNLSMEEEMRKALNEGHDGLIFKNIRDDYHPSTRNKPTNNAIALNLDQIKTKSQLTDIWNKAQGKGELTAQEAVKQGMSAEEWVGSHITGNETGPIDWDSEVTPQSVAPDAQGKTSLEDKIQSLEETQARREIAQEVLKAVQKERSAWTKMIKPYEEGQLAEEMADIPKKYLSVKGAMDPNDAAKSIGLEGDMQLADYFKNLDMQAERLKKEIRDTAPEYLRMKEITALKKKLDAINTGMQKGKVDARKEIQQLQSELIGVIKNLDIEAKDKAKFLDTIKRANTIDALDKEINNVKIRAERYAEAAAKKDLLSDIKKELKYTKPVKKGQKSVGKYDYESNVQFETLRGYEKITQDDAISALSVMPTEGLSQYDLIKARFLSLKANGQSASVELYEQVLEDIKQLKNIGTQAKDDVDFANRIERAQKTDEVINAIQKININKDSLPGKIEAAYRSGFGNTYSMLNSMVGKDLAEKYDPEVKEVDRDVAVFYKTNEIMDKVSRMFGLEDRKLLPNKLQELALNEIPTTDVDGLTKNINKLQVMDIYNSVKNDLGRVRYNNFYGDTQLGEILNTLTPSEVQAADYLQEVMQEYYPILNKRNIEITGRDLGRVDNYWPFTSETKPDVFDDMRIQGEIPSAMKARSQSEMVRPIPTNAIGKALRHIKQAEHVKRLSREYEELKRMFTDRRVKHHLVEKFGENAYKDLMNQIDEISLNRVVSRIDSISRIMDKAVNNWVLAKIAFNPTILARQLGSTTNYIENMPAGDWAKGFMEGILTPKETFNFMWNNAPFLKARFNKGYSEALAEVMKGAEEINANRSDWTKGLSAFARAGDITAIIYGGYPTIKYNIAQGKSLEEAFKIFQSQTLKAQQSGARSGLSRFQNTNNPIARLFLAFKNTSSQYLRKQADAIIQFKNGDISVEQLAKVTTLYSVIQPLLYVFLGAAAYESVKFGLRALTGSDQDEIDAEKILEDSMLQVAVAPFSAIPVIDGIANYAIRRVMDKPAYQVMRTPLLDDIERALQKATAEGAFDEPELVDLLEMFGVIGEAKTGLPIMTAVRYFKSIEE